MSPTELAPRFFLAAAAILLVCRGVQWLGGRVGQPGVVGEMVAGVLLGPSLLGTVWPWAEDQLFPAPLRAVIYVAGQIGLVALMYQAGRALRSHVDRRLAGAAALVSALGVAGPFVLGLALTYLAHPYAPLVVPGVSVGVTATFVATALAITAFPMLARIIVERGLAGSRFGSLALAAGALDDVVAWVLLAGVLGVASARSWPIIEAVGGAALFALVLVGIVRPVLRRWLTRPGVRHETVVLAVLAVLFVAAWWTDEIGLYAVFGAFAVGLVVPVHENLDRLEPVTDSLTRVFLPMFFVYSGLNTHFAVFGQLSVALFAVGAVVAAVVGKFGACWLGARLSGQSAADSARIGALMNARGLMQLIALNVGLQAGLVTPELFTALVLVALVTTVMTAPLLSLLDRRSAAPRAAAVPATPVQG